MAAQVHHTVGDPFRRQEWLDALQGEVLWERSLGFCRRGATPRAQPDAAR